jgi:hypothetical protein
MRKLSWVIENEINFENTISFLKLQISDAIMHYQTNSLVINRKITDKCYSKIRSNASTDPRPDQPSNHLNKQQIRNIRRSIKKSTGKPTTRLNEIFTDLNRYFVSLSGFWNLFIPNICKSISVHNEKCWNETHLHLNSLNRLRVESLFDSNDQKVKDSFKTIENINSTIWRQIESLRLFSEDAIKFMDNGINQAQEGSRTTKSNVLFPNEIIYESNDFSEHDETEATTVTTTSSLEVRSRQTVKLFRTEKYSNEDDEYYYYDTEEETQNLTANSKPNEVVGQKNDYNYDEQEDGRDPEIKNYQQKLVEDEYHEYDGNKDDYGLTPIKIVTTKLTTKVLKEIFAASTVKKMSTSSTTHKNIILQNNSNKFQLCFKLLFASLFLFTISN